MVQKPARRLTHAGAFRRSRCPYSIGPVTTKSVNGSASRDNLAAMFYTACNEILISAVQGDALPVDDKRIAAFEDNHIFVVVVNVRSGLRCFAASPESHLVPVNSIEDETFGVWHRLV